MHDTDDLRTSIQEMYMASLLGKVKIILKKCIKRSLDIFIYWTLTTIFLGFKLTTEIAISA